MRDCIGREAFQEPQTDKVGPTEYKKNYVYLNDYTLYVVEDISGTHTDPYHYKVYFHTDVLPSVEVRP